MDLTAERMLELMVALATRPPLPAGRGAERRAAVRIEAPYRIRVHLTGATAGAAGGPPLAWLRDVCVDGVGVTFTRPLGVGESFVVELARGDGRRPQELLCVVVNCEQAAGGVYHVGAKFLASLAEQELREACARVVAGKARRPQPRQRAARPASVR